MKKRLILSTIALLTTVLILLTSCGTDNTPDVPQETTTAIDTTTIAHVITSEQPSETTPSIETVVPEPYTVRAGVAFKGSVKDIIENFYCNDRLGTLNIYGAPLIRSFAITSADWYENTEQILNSEGWDLQDKSIDFEKYDSEYFKNNYLLMVHIHTGSTTYKYDVSLKAYDDLTIYVTVDQTNPKEPGGFHDELMGDYVYFLEIPAKYFLQFVEYDFTKPY